MKCKCLAILFIALFLLSSCVVTQSISLQKGTTSTSGEASSNMVASDFLVSVLEDLSCWNGDEENAFLDVAVSGIAQSIADSDFSRYVYINKTNDKSYSVSYGFSDFSKMIEQLAQDPNQDIVTLTNDGKHTTLLFNLSMDNYHYLKNIIPLLSDPNFEAYGPVYNNPPYDFRTEEDYLYMMKFIFGEEAQTIADATISVNFDAPSPIIFTTGTLTSEKSTSFEFRLIDFLLLHEPITFSCTY